MSVLAAWLDLGAEREVQLRTRERQDRRKSEALSVFLRLSVSENTFDIRDYLNPTHRISVYDVTYSTKRFQDVITRKYTSFDYFVERFKVSEAWNWSDI